MGKVEGKRQCHGRGREVEVRGDVELSGDINGIKGEGVDHDGRDVVVARREGKEGITTAGREGVEDG